MRILVLPIVLLALLMPQSVFALGLGEISVNSSLNQPLRAEIKLFSVAQDEIEDIQVVLAPQEVFQRVGIDRPFYLNALTFEPELKPDGQAAIKLSTRDPVREPFLTFLVEVKWPKGRLLREYTILLDPPVFLEATAPARTNAPAVETQSANPAKSQPSASRPAASSPVIANSSGSVKPQSPVSAGQRVGRDAVAAGSAPESYATQRGDTLWRIAEATRPSRDTTVEAMMLALQKANPEAFIQGNINNLKAGEILRIPNAGEINQRSSQEMLAEISRQNALWKEYQRSTAVTAAPQNIDAGKLDDSDAQISPEDQPVAENKPAVASEKEGDSEPSLEILASNPEKQILPQAVAAGGGSENLEDLRKQLALSQETAESRARENDELVKRMQRLEALLEKQERILTLQSEQLAEMQQGFAAAASNTGSNSSNADTPSENNTPVDETVVAETAANDAEIPPLVVPEGDISSEVNELDDRAERQAMQDYYASLDQPAEETLATANEQADSANVQIAAPSIEVPVATTEESSPGWIDTLKSQLANPLLLMILAGLGLMVIALIWIVFRRISVNRHVSNVESHDSFAEARVTDSMLEDIIVTQANRNRTALADETLQDKSTTESFADEAADTLSITNAAVTSDTASDDVLDDADVYIGYALYQQAEDLLKAAINKNPDNAAYRVKLAESYYASGDARAFEAVADELLETNVPAKDRRHVLSMGKQLSPDNPLFAAADSVAVDPTDASISENSAFVSEEFAPTQILDARVELDAQSVNDLQANEERAEAPSDDQAEAMHLGNTIAFDMSEPDVSIDGHPGSDDDIAPTVISSADNSNILEFDFNDLDREGFGLDSAEGAEDELLADQTYFDINSDKQEHSEDDSLATRIDAESPDLPAVNGTAQLSGNDSEDELLGTMIDADLANFANEFSLDETLDDEDLTVLFDEGGQSDSPGISNAELDETLLYDGESFSISDSTETFVVKHAGTETFVAEINQDLHRGGVDLMPGIDEIGTKLDLARAYIDMSDNEGARSILTEVLEEGDELQRQQAEELMIQCD